MRTNLLPLAALGLLLAAPLLAHAQQPAAPVIRRADGRNTYVHRIQLNDAQGQFIKPNDPNPKPYSPMQTCAKCHESALISHGWHFNAIDKTVNPGRPGEPWILLDPTTRTQVPLSYRDWGLTFRPVEFGVTPFEFTRMFGRHMPGGGPGALTKVKDENALWRYSGQLEVDCMICHSADNRHDTEQRARQVELYKNFQYAPGVAMGFFQRIEKDSEELAEDDEDPEPGKPPKPAPLHKLNYDKTIFDPQGFVFFDVVREPPASRCYYCHTQAPAHEQAKNTLWRHDGDVHLTSGLKCTDCHKAGIEHMDTRAYPGEYRTRHSDPNEAEKSKHLEALTCAGCHLGTGQSTDGSAAGLTNTLGGRLGSPMPEHRGIPTIHFDKLSCTACHSGPWPTSQPQAIQTSMAHGLGLERPYRYNPKALPGIVEPVFLKGHDGKIAPHRMVWPNYWGWQVGNEIKPISPAAVTKAAGATLPKLQITNPASYEPLTDQQITDTLTKLANGGFDLYDEPQAATPPATQPATQPATAPAGAGSPAEDPFATIRKAEKGKGEPVYISGGKLFRLVNGKLTPSADDDPLAKEHASPYSWPLGHDVRPASQSLGVRGCADCHSTEGAIYFAQVAAIGPVNTAHAVTKTNAAFRGDSEFAQKVWAMAFQGRTLMKILVFTCIAIVALILLTYGLRAIATALVRTSRP